MRIKQTYSGYTMWLSAQDTYKWAHRIGRVWPRSTLSDHRLVVGVDFNGLCDMAVDGRPPVDIDGTELDACITAYLPAEYRHLWPVWKTDCSRCKGTGRITDICPDCEGDKSI